MLGQQGRGEGGGEVRERNERVGLEPGLQHIYTPGFCSFLFLIPFHDTAKTQLILSEI